MKPAWHNPKCTLCPHHDSAYTVCMPGVGPRQAKIMIVGEAPGVSEDVEGVPFIGKSGATLDAMLAKVGVNRDDCYITNTVKCHPDDNETPSRKEVKICVEAYFGEELQAVNPDFILLLGNVALQGVVGKSGITKHRGAVYEARGAKIFATFHPASILYNPRYRSLMEADFQRFGRLVRGEQSPTPETKVKIVSTVPQLRGLCRRIIDAEEVSYDIETYCDHPVGTNFQEYRGAHSKIVSIAFTFEEGQAYAVLLHHEKPHWKNPDRIQAILGQAMKKSTGRFIAHNGLFDASWMKVKDMEVHQDFDTMLAAHMIDENRAKGLKPLSQVLLGADAYDVGDDLHNAYQMDRKPLLVYNGKDTDYTLRIYHHMRDELKSEPRVARVFSKLMMPASNALVDIERNGIQLDMERWQERVDKCQANVEQLRQYMLQYVPEPKRAAINFASPPQMGAWIFGDLGLPIIETTKAGMPSTKESVLLQLGKKHKAVLALLKWRKWVKYLSTYLMPWRDFRDTNDRLHPRYKLYGTVTGRLSCQSPNLQQVPRDAFIRGVIGARPGWSIVAGDLSQAELRVAAMMSNETNMLSQFARGEDIHMLRAMKMTGKEAKDVSKEERKAAKSISFGYLFGMGSSKFVTYARDSYDVEFTPEEAEQVRYDFFNDYPGLVTFHAKQRRLAVKYGRVVNPIGRVRHLPDIYSDDRGVKGEAERQAINSPVQSFASDLVLIALIKLHNMMPADEAIVTGTVHDSILCEVRDDCIDKWSNTVKETMEDVTTARKQFGTVVTVPIVADIEVGKHWGDLKGWEPLRGK